MDLGLRLWSQGLPQSCLVRWEPALSSDHRTGSLSLDCMWTPHAPLPSLWSWSFAVWRAEGAGDLL